MNRPDVAMWGRALQGMPRLDKQAWDELDFVSRWLVATRFAVIVMTFTSVAFAGVLAWKAGAFDGGLFLLVAAGLCLAHATNNLLNDLIDHWKGVDEDNYFRTQYGPQTVQAGFLSVGQLLAYAAITGGVALAIGIYLVMLRGDLALWLLGAGAFFVVLYTWPLKYLGLGEPAVLAVWGPLMVGGSYFVITGAWSSEVAVASLAYALGPTAVLFGKHIDKIDADRAKGIRTLPVILGERISRGAVMAMFVGQLAVIVGLMVTGYFGPAMAIALLPAPWLMRVWSVYREPRPDGPPPELPEGVWPLWFVASAFWYTRRFGGFFVVALLADLAVSRV